MKNAVDSVAGGRWVTISVVVVSLILLGVMLYFTRVDPAPDPGRLASTLNRLNATVYVADNDVDSERQKAAFGPFWDQLHVVNCTQQKQLCADLQISATPSIVIPSLTIELTGYQDIPSLNQVLSKL